MDSVHRVVPLFSGQGADAANAARTRMQGIRDASSPAGSVLLGACFDVFREEMSQLSLKDRLGSEICLDELHTGINLLETSPEAIRNPILSGLRLFLFQALRYLDVVGNSGSSQSRFRDALVHPGAQSLGILGFSSGLLAACVVASSPSLPAFISRSVEAFRLAFWIGFRTQEYRNSVLNDADSAARQLPWSVVLLGLDQDLVEAAIQDFRTQVRKGSHHTSLPDLLYRRTPMLRRSLPLLHIATSPSLVIQSNCRHSALASRPPALYTTPPYPLCTIPRHTLTSSESRFRGMSPRAVSSSPSCPIF